MLSDQVGKPACSPIDAQLDSEEAASGFTVQPGVQRIAVKALVVGHSPRLSGIDAAHVERLAECGAELPPIVIHRKTLRVIDGLHRLCAAVRNQRELVDVIYFDGSESEAFILAVELNVKHGLPLSLRDRKAAASRILASGTDLSDRAIAAKTGLSDKTIAAIRMRSGAEIPHTTARRGRDGRVYSLDGIKGRQQAARAVVGRAPPGTAPPARTPRPARPTQKNSPDKRMALEQLRADPSFRNKETCRDLLRWLATYAVDGADLPDHTIAVPSHRLQLVITLARQSASAWLEFARRLDAERQERES